MEPVFNADGVTVRAKTGTAQAPPLRFGDTNGDGTVDDADDHITDLDHAWCVGLAGPRSTGVSEYAIAVVVEYGGSGGRVAGPIVNQIIHALQDEGYLPHGETPEGDG
jgi:cell division protein FtsI/penicillin-binding protein 2